MILVLCLSCAIQTAEAFRAHLVVEEGARQIRYVADFKAGRIRVQPLEGEVYLLIDVESKSVSFVRPQERVYSRLAPEDLRRLVAVGLVSPSWFPWVYRVSPDLVRGVTLRKLPGSRLPDGSEVLRTEVYSETYRRVVAEYWLDPKRSGNLFFQWRDLYGDLWREGEPDVDEAQQERIEIYRQLEGLPWKMEERFTLLTRPRTLRLEKLEPSPADAFSVPSDFTEKTGAQLLWEELLHRLEKWLFPQRPPKEPKPPKGRRSEPLALGEAFQYTFRLCSTQRCLV